jgi:1,4-dihydroxy-2-naphthoate octaprenyltransferase
MRVDRAVVYRYRAIFGAGFLVLGAVTFWRVAAARAPLNTKVLGALFALVLMGLGAARIAQYVRGRRELR